MAAISELHDAGLSQRQIALRLHCSQRYMARVLSLAAD
jgi:hypothetical protein